MSAKKQLKNSIYSIYSILKHNRDGSFSTQGHRQKRLFQMANDLVNGGFKLKHIQGLKQKHVQYLVEQWKTENLSAGTMKNRLTDLRWIAEKIDHKGVVPSNQELAIPDRHYVTNVDKSISLDSNKLEKIKNQAIRLSLQLQQQFGLRRGESLKIKPFLADKTNHLWLKGSWCKNGRERIVEIRTQEQRDILEECKRYVGKPDLSLIPELKTYKQQLNLYTKQLQRAGISKAHGLRHAYAQKRYQEITGWKCPVKGGPHKNELTAEQIRLDREARLQISNDLGHDREDVLAVYVGK